jgi:hypothetical protein
MAPKVAETINTKAIKKLDLRRIDMRLMDTANAQKEIQKLFIIPQSVKKCESSYFLMAYTKTPAARQARAGLVSPCEFPDVIAGHGTEQAG